MRTIMRLRDGGGARRRRTGRRWEAEASITPDTPRSQVQGSGGGGGGTVQPVGPGIWGSEDPVGGLG